MPQRRASRGNRCGALADDTWKISTSSTAIENGYRKSSSILWSYNKETSRSPCSTSFEESVGFKLEEATWPKAEALD
ncbi:hypothetical protein RB195_025107 [Necator americanus]|uniref:Uncharacterized protein n=1 Tax=Necator americanus TaxID=51031 RepID=A0ABR1EQX8_NECAM